MVHARVCLIVAVFDIVFKGGAIALNVDIKHIFNGIAIVEKRATRDGVAIAQRRTAPQAVELVERDASVRFNGVDQPYIDSDFVASHSRNRFDKWKQGNTRRLP